MSQFFQIHPDNPQSRLIKQAVDIILSGGIVVYPTDSAYAIGCRLGDKRAAEAIRSIRRLDDKHNFTLMCRDLSEIATYARVDNVAYRLIKSHTPGPYTFILRGTSEVPRRLMHAKRKTIGLRVPNNAIALALLEELGEPMMSVTLIMPGDELPLTDPYEFRGQLEHATDLIIDGGYCGIEPSSVISMLDSDVSIVRQGLGDTSGFECL
ncbi:tRNA threonylcarbamoyl adenosine modification protein (Sua5/YciO/YrdC/YwlC family) [Sinobacterium caligoides]|uniref:tRNA threonylcarbamoyl adenosine modification protein (Sua5/YciO/YrdC/YwlC family) n=1 Tax=Sinobacterium caligoides TaxID=933926 RepID=A0A3N2DYK4_9GAMM|nr:L-threonylcarbamoyladenylate synthase [Sinobacterium caligoides]ROS04752.1 tRNA threonylcarbamoyl adenosine modification protein (Sua5/YciO/YrdC/YwlC family) [Sinobacterium caligoides]